MIDPLRLAADVVRGLARLTGVDPLRTRRSDDDREDLDVVPSTTPERFRWESEMLDPVAGGARTLAPWLEAPATLVAEVPAAIGIVDLLGVAFDRRALDRRVEADVRPVVSPLRVRVLHRLLAGPTDIDELAASVGSHGEALTRSTLRPLEAAELIELEDGVARSTGLWMPVGDRIVAVELKLSKWRDALYQAENFGRSADESWVVLDAARAAGAVAARDEFIERGVGLAVAAQGGDLQALLPAERTRPEGWLRALIAERALSAWDEYEPIFAARMRRRNAVRPRLPSEPRTVAVVG